MHNDLTPMYVEQLEHIKMQYSYCELAGDLIRILLVGVELPYAISFYVNQKDLQLIDDGDIVIHNVDFFYDIIDDIIVDVPVGEWLADELEEIINRTDWLKGLEEDFNEPQ